MEPLVCTDGGSAEGGSRQSLVMVWQWTSWAPGDGASHFDFHQDVDSNYTACGTITIKQGELKSEASGQVVKSARTGAKRVWSETQSGEGEPDSVLFACSKMHTVKVQIMIIVRSHFSLISAVICWHLLGASWVQPISEGLLFRLCFWFVGARLMASASQTDAKMDFLCLD